MSRACGHRILLAVWTAIGLVVAAAWWRESGHPDGLPVGAWQAVDTPLAMPGDGEPDFRLQRLTAWQVAALPRATSFDEPMGSEHGALTYNAQPFWEMNEARGGRHLGDDLNGIGGMNTDLGDPVFAPGDGMVVFAGEPASGWGKVVVLAHQTPDGRCLQSMFAHLDRIEVALGEVLARGAVIGRVGTANGNYPAHLHCEFRAGDGVDIGGGYGDRPLDRLNPAKVFAEFRANPPEALAPAPLAIVLAHQDE